MKSLILASLVLSAFSAVAAPNLKGESSLKQIVIDGRKVLEKIETTFYEDQIKREVYKFTARNLIYWGADGSNQSGTIELYTSKKSLFDTLAYTVKVKGAELLVYNDELLQVNEYGCCDSPTYNRFLKRSNGALVEAALNGSTVQIEVPNSDLKMRYIAVVADSKAPKTLGSKKYIGTVSYFDGNDIKDRVRVYADLPDGYGADLADIKTIVNGKNEKRNDILTLWENDGVKDEVKAFSGFGIEGSVYLDGNTENFSILVNGDKFDRTNSKATGALELVFQ